MMNFKLFIESPAQKSAKQRWVEDRLRTAQPWTPNIKWERVLTIKASTYKPRALFDVPAVALPYGWGDLKGEHSPQGTWCYAHTLLPRGTTLEIYNGRQRGTVMFDGDVLIPSLYEKPRTRTPWMSHTPMEVLTLRGGTRRAKGHVIVAGLGLGHQFIEVMQRRQVTEVTLVEKSAELVEWILPRVLTHCNLAGRTLNIVIGDAMEELPKLTADVALVDIFEGYGHNDLEQTKLRRTCKSIEYVWCWGAAVTTGGSIWE